MGYFTNFPKVSLPSFADNRSSSLDFVNSTNLFKRGKIREEIVGSIAAFERYSINGDDRPDNVAFRVYGDSSLDWVILISNNILNVRDEWPMNQYDFKRYIDNKYSTSLLTQIHHYESKETQKDFFYNRLEYGLMQITPSLGLRKVRSTLKLKPRQYQIYSLKKIEIIRKDQSM